MPSKEDTDSKKETGREVFTHLLKGEPLSRPAFIPLPGGLLVRVGGVSLKDLTLDPTLWASCLKKTAELFGFEGIVVGFDFTFMAEACGSEIFWENDEPSIVPLSQGVSQTPEKNPRMNNALEVAQRVFQLCRPERVCLAALTGPVTLASQLFGVEKGPQQIHEVKQLVTQVTEAFCKLRPDVLLFMEDTPLTLSELHLNHRRIYTTLKNIAAYYNIPSGLYLQGYQPEQVQRFAKLAMDLYILGPSSDNDFPSLSDLWNLAEGALGVGISLPFDNLKKVREIITQVVEFYHQRGGPRFFFTSHGPVTKEVDLEILHQVSKEIRQLRL